MFQPQSFKAFQKVTTEQMVKLLCNSPVSVALRVTACFKAYSQGILDSECAFSNTSTTNHYAVLVGFGVDQTVKHGLCKEYWLVKNSWGVEWGEQGYVRLCKEEVSEGLGAANILGEAMIVIP